MPNLGFVTAILPDLSLEEVFVTAKQLGYDTVEVMCWPVGKAQRRYAGVTHIDVTDFTQTGADQVRALSDQHGVSISALGYYPNPLAPDAEESAQASDHIRRVIDAAAVLGLSTINTFIGRDWTKSVPDNWSRFLEVWTPLIAHADANNIRVGIENCPMSFTYDEWPG